MRKTTGERDKWNSEKDNERKREKGERYWDNKKEKERERVTERVAMWERERKERGIETIRKREREWQRELQCEKERLCDMQRLFVCWKKPINPFYFNHSRSKGKLLPKNMIRSE